MSRRLLLTAKEMSSNETLLSSLAEKCESICKRFDSIWLGRAELEQSSFTATIKRFKLQN